MLPATELANGIQSHCSGSSQSRFSGLGSTSSGAQDKFWNGLPICGVTDDAFLAVAREVDVVRRRLPDGSDAFMRLKALTALVGD